MSGESARLKERGASQWAAALAHPMVAEIGAGTLPHATFRFYLEQNISYLREYARAIAFAAADPVYRDWGSLFSGDGDDELVVASTDLLDASCTAADQPRTADAFDRSVCYEIAFW